MKKITLELGDDALDEIMPWETVQEKVDTVKGIFSERNVDADVIFYSSFDSINAGGRHAGLEKYDFLKLTGELNSIVASIVLILNGGLTLNQNTPLDDSEKEVLALLNYANESQGLSNKVTITNDTLLESIRSDFPSVDVVASCIQLLERRNKKDYSALFEDYDYVVPLAQHTTYDFLKEYEQFADKMILFMKMGCSRSEFNLCYNHYYAMEAFMELGGKRFEKDDSQYMPFIHKSALSSRGDSCQDFSSALINRTEDLERLVEMGVNKFKMQRRAKGSYVLDEKDFIALAQYFN